MQARPCLTSCNFRSKGHIISISVSQITNHPFGNHQLICRLRYRNRQELNLILLINIAIQRKITHFGVSILYLPACLCDIRHTLSTELIEFSVWTRFVITTLVGCLKHTCIRGYYIIFQFAHCLKFHSGNFCKSFACFVKGVFWCTFERFAVFVEERAKHGQRRNLGKRINECSAETGNHIKVTTARFYERKKTGAVYPFSTSKNSFQIGLIVDDKVQGFQTTVSRRIHEIDHADIFLLDK